MFVVFYFNQGRLKENQRQHEIRIAEIEKSDSMQHQHWKQKF